MERSGQIAVLAHLALVFATGLLFAILRPPTPARVARVRQPLRTIASWAYWATGPVLRTARALRVTPDVMTGVGVVLSVAAGVFAGLSAYGWAFVTLLWGSAADLLDGELARSTGTSSRAGAFLDSNLDRVSEMALLGGVAVALHPSLVRSGSALAALAASFMVSYARARGEGLGVSCPSFGLERPHRLVAFMVAMLVVPFLAAEHAARLLTAVCSLVAVGAGVTALGRMVTIHQLLRAGEAAQGGGLGAPPGPTP